MKNKRLLAMLIVFVFVASTAIMTGTVFVVRSYSISFRNSPEFITDPSATISRIRAAVNPYVEGRNILFGLDRAHITEEIESTDPRVRVTNIEARFPNRLEITVRERYPQFVYRGDGRTLILDSRLRIVDDRPLARNLIDISGEFYLNVRTATIGTYLFDYLPETTVHNRHYRTMMERLTNVPEFFYVRYNREDALNHLFSTIEFCTIRGELDVRLMISSATIPGAIRTEILVQGIEDEMQFFEMFRSVWHVKEEEARLFPGLYRVFITDEGTLRVVSPRQILMPNT